ncbi:copper amine oxidase N-terminal domain-containing protein [Paenibacillus sp. NEAU-GSW1]|uniref:copper amine oxidase N-terminal domain-containing protein n=1 Tax=Paenibacillus sp. NEAU-GSW1 TaxID=2682486 RepID=UPI0012E2F33F|nr:copper amine oxidase N-terminal domain-containing protein [Paenibacillus sp. NEAU-GSW1]MUT64975.1 hypothetical protein [Paenibacillus sp. NEAU-GSW1]
MKRTYLLLLAMLVFSTLLPGTLFAATSSDAGAVEVRLKTGSSTVTINGAKSTVQAPYEASGTTMVPLSIITKAFGAKLQLEDNKIITLSYNDKKIVVTIGSKTVKVNGSNKTVAVAPVIVKGTTMVPVRVIVEAFGASISKDAATKEIVIKGKRAETTSSGGINTDSGKTKVGDSYMGWSMNYPPGLALISQNDDGSMVYWADTKTGNSLHVIIEDNAGEMSSSDIREELQYWMESDEVLIDKRTLTISGYSVEKLVTRSKEYGMMYEYRAILHNDKLYMLIGGVVGKDRTALESYQNLFNSFLPVFDKTNKALKDISNVVDGLRTYHDEDYGVTLKLPPNWRSESDESGLFYYSNDEFFTLKISSLLEGDTADAWLQRKKANLVADFVPDYLRNVTTSEIKLQDGNALVLSYEVSYDKKEWQHINEVFLVVGDYRYQMTFYYDVKKAAEGEKLFLQSMTSIDIDTDFISKEFGLIEDESDMVDRSKKVVKKSSTYGYSFELPAYWTGSFNESNFFFSDDYNFMNGMVLMDRSMSEVIELLAMKDEDEVAEEAAEEAVASSEREFAIGGKTGKLLTQYEPNYKSTYYSYLVEHKGNVLALMFSISDSNATADTLKRVEEIVKSVKLF